VADELQPALEEGLDPNAAPAEGAAPEDDTPEPIRNLASEMGWVPKDQFRGDPNDWKPASDFIKAGRDINRGLSRDLRTMRDQIDRLGRTSSQLLEDKLAERDQYWKNVHAKAVEEGDVSLAERASDERLKLKQSAPADTGEPAETQDFRQRNDAWFGKDDLATIRAMEVAEQARKLGKSIPDQLAAAERAVKREFPELFKAPKAAPSTQTGTSRTATTSSKAKGFADMPPESQKMARDYETRHGIKPEDFAKSYWADQAKRERKVG
jgi:hypothetical protein